MRTVTRFAFAVRGERRGPWRDHRKEAELDALRNGCAARDPYDPDVVFVSVPAEIISREVEPPMEDNVIWLSNGRGRPPLRLVL